MFAWSQIYFPFTSTNVLTDRFLLRFTKNLVDFSLSSYHWNLFKILTPSAILSKISPRSFLHFVYSLKFAFELKLDSSYFSFFSNSHWLLLVFCKIFLEKVTGNLQILYLSNSHFIWSVCFDSDDYCCLLFQLVVSYARQNLW